MSVRQDANMSCCAGITGLLMPSHCEPDTLNSAHFKMEFEYGNFKLIHFVGLLMLIQFSQSLVMLMCIRSFIG